MKVAQLSYSIIPWHQRVIKVELPSCYLKDWCKLNWNLTSQLRGIDAKYKCLNALLNAICLIGWLDVWKCWLDVWIWPNYLWVYVKIYTSTKKCLLEHSGHSIHVSFIHSHVLFIIILREAAVSRTRRRRSLYKREFLWLVTYRLRLFTSSQPKTTARLQCLESSVARFTTGSSIKTDRFLSIFVMNNSCFCC